MNIEDQQIISQLANERLGVPPQAQGQMPGAPAPQQKPQASQAPTQQERAIAQSSPKDASAKAKDDALTVLEVDFGESKKQLTPSQIKNTFDRYAQMNYRWQSEVAPMKPVLEMARNMLDAAGKNGAKATPDELARFLDSAAKAYVQNAQMGAKAGGQIRPDGQPDKPSQPAQGSFKSFGEQDLARWERENAVTLPPKYKESMLQMEQMQRQMQEMQRMLQEQGKMGQNAQMSEVQRATKLAQGAKQASDSAAKTATEAMRQSVMNNLQKAQQKFNLPDEAEQEFMAFMMERGYTPADFVDEQLTMAVAGDFNNLRSSPEMERLRSIARRRQAFTGNIQGAPGGAVGGTTPSGGDDFFNQMVAGAMTKRGLA